METWENKKTDSLFEAITSLKNTSEAKKFLRDLMTKKEIIEFSNRWKAAQMLNSNIPYSKIVKETGLSSTTVARVSKWLNNGREGYKLILARMHHKNSSHGKELR